MADCQVPIKAVLSPPLLYWTGGENMTKGSWIEIRTEKSLSNYSHVQNSLNLGKLI